MRLKKSKLKHKLNQFVFEAIGTKWVIDFKGSPTFSGIEKLISDFDNLYSRFRQDSLVMEMAKSKGTYTIPHPELIDLYYLLYKKTEGQMTPLIGSLMEQTGYDANYSLNPKNMTPPKSWESSLIWDSPNLTVKEPSLLDFGAAGKGLLVDLVAKELDRQEIKSYSIDAGGDIFLKNFPSKIGLENPANTNQVIGIVDIENSSICGSSGSRRKWRGFHHIIDPRNLKSVDEVLAVWVIADSAMLADGLSTALFFCPAEKLSDFSFNFLIIYPDFTFKKSENFNAKLYQATR